MENKIQEEFEFVELKKCTVCKEEKYLADFNLCSRSKSRLSYACKACDRARCKKYHKENPEVAKNREVRNRHRNHQLVFDYLITHPCIICGETDPIVLEFDHRDPSEKSFCISAGCSEKRPVKDIMEEVKKCDVLCANCHRQKTAKDRRYFAYRVIHEGYQYNPKTYKEFKSYHSDQYNKGR